MTRRFWCDVAATSVLAVELSGLCACRSEFAGDAPNLKPPAASSSVPGSAGATAPGAPNSVDPSSPPEGRRGGGSKTVQVVRPVAPQSEDGYPSNLYVEGDVKVSARRSGVIERIEVDRGSRVRMGQVLARLESDVDSHELEMAEQDLRLAQSEYDRLKVLRESKVASPQDYDRAEIARDAAKSKVDLQRALLEYCTVRSPADGVVVERWAVVGMRVQEDDDTPLFRIAPTGPMRARIDVPEQRVGSLVTGSRATIEQRGGGTSLPARVVFVGPAVDPASGTAPVIVETSAGAGSARLGSSVRVRLEGAGPDLSALEIPRDALPPGPASEGSEATVLVSLGGHAVARRVRVIESRGAMVRVRGGIGPEDRVIVAPDLGVEAGDPIVPRETAP